MEPEAARRNALVKFGGVERAKEYARDEARPVLLEDATRDVRYGIRSLLRAPGFALISILTLGLGIGAATAVFSVVQGVLLRPLAYPQHERIVRMFQIDKDGNRLNSASEANFEDWKRQTRSFSAMAEMVQDGEVSVGQRDRPGSSARAHPIPVRTALRYQRYGSAGLPGGAGLDHGRCADRELCTGAPCVAGGAGGDFAK